MNHIKNSFLNTSSVKEQEDFLLPENFSSEVTPPEKPDFFNLPKFNFEWNRNSTMLPYFQFFDTNIQINKEQFSSSENKINQSREEFLYMNISPIFLNLLKEEDFEFGYKTRSEEILIEQFNINELAVRNWLNELFVRHFNDEKILIGILRILGRFDEKIIFPQGQTMALAALSHESDEIKELGIRAFEKWCSLDSLKILRTIKTEIKWLQDYVDQVIFDIEEQLCLS